MKVINKPVNALVVFTAGKNQPRPYKIKFENERGELIRINVDDILYVEKRKQCGDYMLVYSCQSEIEGVLHRFELRYLFKDANWELFKI